ncbi:MAG: SusD/RagB family nutrient-binding outer membrane lipoprotein [Bacteroidota bacterium]
MKYYLNKLGLLVVLFSLSACNLFELDEFLVDPTAVAPENAEVSLIMNAAQWELARLVDEANDETSPYVRLQAMQGDVFYQGQDQPATFDFFWTTAYADLLPDLDAIITQSDEGGFTFVAGAARVMEAYVLYTLVDMFGDVPFSEARAGIETPSPRADDDAAVYEAATAILDVAIQNLSAPVGTFDGDLFFGGDSEKWLTLARTLKLRSLVQTRLVTADGGAINSLVDAGIIDEASEDFAWQYGTSMVNPDARHPEYSDDYSVDAGGYMNNYYMWLFFGEKPVLDPRLRYYFYRQDCDETDENAFTLACPNEPYPAHWEPGFPFCTASSDFGDPSDMFGGYWGRDHGNADGIPPDGNKRTVFGVYPIGGKFDADDCASVQNNGADGARGAGIQPIFMSSYTHFLLAEAALTIPGVNGDPLEYLLEGIRQSIDKAINFDPSQTPADFEPTQDEIDAYLTTVTNLYNAASNDDERLEVIIKEFFLALHGNGLDAYNAYRRTGKPGNMQRTETPNEGAFPRTLWYPSNYVNRNENAGQKANLEVQVFWDTNPAGFIN